MKFGRFWMNRVDLLVWIAYFISLYIAIFWLLNVLEIKKSKKKIKIKKWPSVTVIIPAYNEEKHIRECIESVLNLDYYKNKVKIIVVNDGSKDGTREVVERIMREKKDRNITLINQKNSGKAKSLNKALKIVKTEFFACLDADSVVSKEALKRIIKTFYEYDENLSIVTPAMKIRNPENLLQKLQYVEYNISMLLHRLMSNLNSIYVAPGPFSVYRTEVVKRLGGFDSTTLAEDQEIAYRMQKNFYDIKQSPKAFVYTTPPKNFNSLYRQRRRWYIGGFSNIIKYKELFLNPKYGHFGIVQMPFNLLNFIMAFLGVFLITYYIFLPVIRFLRNIFIIKFDIYPYIKTFFSQKFKLSLTLIELNAFRTMIIIVLLVISLSMLFFAFKNANEKNKRKSLVLLLIIYFFIYYAVLSFVCVISVLEFIILRKSKW
jgi:cellulose synthase/poly-beta-1,6-N-acetylglucosamine synthase-like glycosyltransferase